ncbi:MAG: MoaD/ThiS family protein [Deltaproteobacteria bacterium]|nr:MoaD/ThiS family protein [Deltaproteobacteria bacterium]
MSGPVTVTVQLPSLLRSSAGGLSEVRVEASTLENLLESLFASYPLLRRHLVDEKGNLRPHVNLFLDDADVRWLDDWREPLEAGTSLTVLQAVSGG